MPRRVETPAWVIAYVERLLRKRPALAVPDIGVQRITRDLGCPLCHLIFTGPECPNHQETP